MFGPRAGSAAFSCGDFHIPQTTIRGNTACPMAFLISHYLSGGIKGFQKRWGAPSARTAISCYPHSRPSQFPSLGFRWKRSPRLFTWYTSTLTSRWSLSSLGAPSQCAWLGGARVLICRPVLEVTRSWVISSTCLPPTLGRNLLPGLNSMVRSHLRPPHNSHLYANVYSPDLLYTQETSYTSMPWARK